MDLTIETAHDLIRIINAYPQWRRLVRESLFPEIDLPKAFQELADAQQRTEQTVRELSQTVRDLSRTVKELVQTQQETSRDIRKLHIIVKHHTTRLGRIDKKMLEAAQERGAIKDDLEVIKRGQEDLRHEVRELRHGQDELKRNQNDLRGQSYERKIRDRADAIFGRFLKRGRKMRNEIGDYLEEANPVTRSPNRFPTTSPMPNSFYS
jgi:chromosome segregation ATPase